MVSLTCPRSGGFWPLDERVLREMHRAIDERYKARCRGDWPSRMAWDEVIRVLVRMQQGEGP